MIQLQQTIQPIVSYQLASNIDPTRTLTIRTKFVGAMRNRFAQLMAVIRHAVIELDVLALNKEKLIANALPATGLTSQQFNFPSSDQKIEAFVAWMGEQNQKYILSGGTTGIRTMGDLIPEATAARNSWITTYIDSAYQKGISRARSEMQKLGIPVDDGTYPGSTSDPIQVAFNNPMNADRVGMIYTRAYSSLKGITDAMDSTVSDVLALGIADGRGPREIARLLNKAITGDGTGEDLGILDSLGRFIPAKRRAETLARTEVIRAHHQANMAEYRAAGLLGIKVQAEFLTAGDARVCPECASLNGKIMTLDQAENLIPVHPQCRCVALPYIPEDKVGGQPAPEAQAPSEFTPVKTLEEAKKNISDLFNINIGEFGTFTLSDEQKLRSMNLVGTELQRLNNDIPGISDLTSKPKTHGTNYPGRELSVSISDNTNLGLYSPSLNEINIGPIAEQIKTPLIGETYSWNSVYDDSLYPFRHEYGHAIHQQGLTQSQFEDWYFLYKDKTMDFWEKTVSEYGGVSPSELFAESFAEYTCSSYKPGTLPIEIESFFKKVFKK